VTAKPYVSGRTEWRWPFAGDDAPPGGAQVLLLTEGGVCVRGAWVSTGAFHAWAPLPDVNREKQRETRQRLAQLRFITSAASPSA
jgi:hypothetical protein